MPSAIRELARASGEPVPETTAATVRAALESVATGVRRTVLELDGMLGRRISRIHVVGGGVKNALLCQMVADATNRPVVAGPVEATAIGNVLVQLLATNGTVDLRAIRQVVRDTFEPVHYEPKDAKRWDDRLG
jgi:rhamnulokinase